MITPLKDTVSDFISVVNLSRAVHTNISAINVRGHTWLAEPFQYPPLSPLWIFPLGVIPKKVPGEFRLIHHLSFPKGSSVNDGIPPENTSVH